MITTTTLSQSPYIKYATIYENPDTAPACQLLYIHGGGLLSGSRLDLPEKHIQKLTDAGCRIIALDYPLAPAADIRMILDDIITSINQLMTSDEIVPDAVISQSVPGNRGLPCFLWGRSAGAYLCLLAAASGKLKKAPAGVISYYGYGLLTDLWFQEPNAYYNTLPQVPASCLEHLPVEIHTSGDMDTHYSAYVYARQSGKWKDLIYEGKDKDFYLNYSLRTCDALPCPLFCAHSTGDPDVPYAEFTALVQKYQAKQYVASGNVHDFDRNEKSFFTRGVLDATVQFVKSCLTD